MTFQNRVDHLSIDSLFGRKPLKKRVDVAKIIDGKLVSEAVKSIVTIEVKKLGLKPGLATILVGEDPASQVYIKNKIKSTEACGMNSFHETLPVSITQEELIKKITELNRDPKVHGILVQMPLPKHIQAAAVIAAIDPKKDVDGFCIANVGVLMADKAGSSSQALMPCTPSGVIELLKYYEIEISGKNAIILGRSAIVGKPVAMMLLNENATITVAHSKTQNLAELVKNADIVVAAIGKANFVKGEWVKPGAVVIDVGINRLPDGKLCGDVDFKAASEHASFITPVPGGVGPMTIAMLMKNTLEAAKFS